jgi:hypothetical protein
MPALAIWIWLCACLNCAGWLLSALHQLNAGGYAAALALALAGLGLWWNRSGAPPPAIPWRKLRRRFRRPFPLAFLTLAALALLGGLLYAPSNYDALSYRVPRILHWLAAGQWHWIHTLFPRLNQRCCGIEWISAPILALSHAIWPLFLINFISFGFFPGQVFSVFTRLGVRPRVAWYWMWLLPTGYCFLLQAASLGNDLFGAVFVLAAMEFALRAARSRSRQELFTSVLAAALMTSAKPSNLPLLLPWALALLPSAPRFLRHPLSTLLLFPAAALASYVPSALLNLHFCGDWTGLKVETGVTPSSPFFLIATNAFLLCLSNFSPPICPLSGWWDGFFPRHVPAALAAQWEHAVEDGLRSFHLSDLQIEESAGLGFGLCLLVVVSVLAVLARRRPSAPPPASLWLQAVRWSPVISLLVVMAHCWMSAISREITPYYGLLLPIVLAPAGHAWLVRRSWWRFAAGSVFALALVPLVLSPARPLFPALTVCRLWTHVPARAKAVYTVYRSRPDGFAPVKALLPADAAVLGFVGYDDPEASLWTPLGSRRIEHIRPEDTAADLKSRGIRYILFHTDAVEAHFHVPLAVWLQQHDAAVIQTLQLSLRVASGPKEWQLARLN